MAARLTDSPDRPDSGELHKVSIPGNAPYLQGLNDRQLEAVECLDGPVLVLAGAGSGKTRTLTARAAHLICTGRAWPSQILAVTFTNRAALEMRQRVEKMAGLHAQTLPWMGTFHSICARILRRHAEAAGLTSQFTILDTDDQLRLLKQLIKDDGLDEKIWPARHIGGLIDRWKNRCLLPEQVPRDDYPQFNGRGVVIYRRYQARLTSLNAVDFGDLILLVVKIFRDQNEILERYGRAFRYILVDEYQDTNTAQYLWLQLLAGQHHNICCVGDDDQSIYGWRGAEVENILQFERCFANAHIVRLEQNYRSTAHILATAGAVIACNRGRLGKTLWTAETGGEKVRVAGCADSQSEARWIASEIENLSVGAGYRPVCALHEIAVLVRASYQMRVIEERFLALGLPYRVIGGPRFYERKEIRDALAYLRLTRSCGDDLAFERVINLPRRGIGAKGQAQIQSVARNAQISLFEASRQILAANAIKGRAATGLREFIDRIEQWTQLAVNGGLTLEELTGRVLDESGMTEMLKRENTPESQGRLENLKELVKSLRDFDNLNGFLEHVALVYDNLEDTGTSKVSLMTLHAAKGLEFPAVFLPGWEEDVFPSRRAAEDPVRGIEEERRLAYVGITRAMQLCYISHCASRFLYGESKASLPSRFVEELPAAHIEVITPPGMFGIFERRNPSFYAGETRFSEQSGAGYSSPGFRRMQARAQNQNRSMTAVRTGANGGGFSAGERVFTVKFGYGEVISVSDDILQIAFERAGTKRLLAQYVQKADGTEG